MEIVKGNTYRVNAGDEEGGMDFGYPIAKLKVLDLLKYPGGRMEVRWKNVTLPFFLRVLEKKRATKGTSSLGRFMRAMRSCPDRIEMYEEEE